MKSHQAQIISCLYCDLEAEALAKCLEMYDCDVIKSRVGCSDDFISLVNGTNIYEGTDIIIICAHGNDDLGVNSLIASSSNIDPNNYDLIYFNEKLLKGVIPKIPVICLGCWTGTKQFAEFFLNNGCDPYIAPEFEIDTKDSFMFMSTLLYNYFVKELSIKESFYLSNKKINKFNYFKKEV